MAKKERAVRSETIWINRFDTGWTVEAGRWYREPPCELFERFYANPMELIQGLATYLRLGVARQEEPRFPGAVTVFKIRGSDEKVT